MPSLNCLATVAQAKQKPSWVDGIPPDLEEELCVFGCQQIQQAGILLHLPQVAMGCAQVLFQRFWFVSSMRQFSMMDIAMGAVLLASKLAEDPLRLRDVLLVFDYLEQRARHVAHHVPGPRLRESQQSSSAAHILPFTYKPSGYYSDAYYDAKDAIVVAEMQILKRLGFDVQVTLPHALMINYLQILGIVDHELEILGTPSTAAQVAWGYLNDAYVSHAYTAFNRRCIACSLPMSLPVPPFIC